MFLFIMKTPRPPSPSLQLAQLQRNILGWWADMTWILPRLLTWDLSMRREMAEISTFTTMVKCVLTLATGQITIIAGRSCSWMVGIDKNVGIGWIQSTGRVRHTIPISGWLYAADSNCGEQDCWFTDPHLKFIKTWLCHTVFVCVFHIYFFCRYVSFILLFNSEHFLFQYDIIYWFMI